MRGKKLKVKKPLELANADTIFLRDTIYQLQRGHKCYAYDYKYIDELLALIDFDVEIMSKEGYYEIIPKNIPKKPIY